MVVISFFLKNYRTERIPEPKETAMESNWCGWKRVVCGVREAIRRVLYNVKAQQATRQH